MKLFFRHFGEGQPLIILHGIFGLSDNWVTHAKKLAGNFSVYLPDLRNHGHSPHSPTFNYHAMADDLKEFIEEHKLHNPIVAGHSMGGKVAMLFALENPEMLEKLIVIDISPVKYPDRDAHFDIISAMMSINFDAIHHREDVFEILKLSIPSERIRLFIMKNLHRKTKNSYDWRLNLNAISSNMDLVFAGIEHDGTFDKPVLFIKGGQSDYIKEAYLPGIKKLFPDYKLKTIESAGHWLHAEAPDELCNLLGEFLEQPCS